MIVQYSRRGILSHYLIIVLWSYSVHLFEIGSIKDLLLVYSRTVVATVR